MICRSLGPRDRARGSFGGGMRRIGPLAVLLLLVLVAIFWLRSISG
jgi:hypothetical protein